MSDLVERLRQDAGWHTAQARPRSAAVNREAADEIERLRAQVVSLQSSLDAGPPRPGKKTPDALKPDAPDYDSQTGYRLP